MAASKKAFLNSWRVKVVGGLMPFVSHVLRVKHFCENAKEPFFPKTSLLEVKLDKKLRRLVSTITSEYPVEGQGLGRPERALGTKSDFPPSDRKAFLRKALNVFLAQERQIFRLNLSLKSSGPVKTGEWVEAHEVHLPLPENSDVAGIEKQLRKLKGVKFTVVG